MLITHIFKRKDCDKAYKNFVNLNFFIYIIISSPSTKNLFSQIKIKLSIGEMNSEYMLQVLYLNGKRQHKY